MNHWTGIWRTRISSLYFYGMFFWRIFFLQYIKLKWINDIINDPLNPLGVYLILLPSIHPSTTLHLNFYFFFKFGKSNVSGSSFCNLHSCWPIFIKSGERFVLRFKNIFRYFSTYMFLHFDMTREDNFDKRPNFFFWFCKGGGEGWGWLVRGICFLLTTPSSMKKMNFSSYGEFG